VQVAAVPESAMRVKAFIAARLSAMKAAQIRARLGLSGQWPGPLRNHQCASFSLGRNSGEAVGLSARNARYRQDWRIRQIQHSWSTSLCGSDCLPAGDQARRIQSPRPESLARANRSWRRSWGDTGSMAAWSQLARCCKAIALSDHANGDA
jgi:hypothetical protein